MKEDLKKTHAAILFSDIVGYTALMGENQDLAFELVNKNLKIHLEVLEKHNGKLIKELGDGILCSFPDSNSAVTAAYELQQYYFISKELNLRIGIHYGEVILDRNDVFGDAVNIASRLQTLGVPGSILFSKKIQEGIRESTTFITVSKGLFKLKNVKEPIEVFALANEGLKIPKRGEMLKLLESRLKKLMLGSVILLSVFLIGFLIYHNASIKKLLPDHEKTIAVLPFKNLDIADENDYFIEGFTFDIISQLSKISGLLVIGNSSSQFYKDSEEPIKEIAKELGVRYVLEGTIQRIYDSIIIKTELIDGINENTIWSERFEGNINEILKIQSEISLKTSSIMGVELDQNEMSMLEKVQTKEVSAYEYYLKGRSLYFNYDPQSNQKAIIEFKKALKIDPNYAIAWAGLGDAFSVKQYWMKSESFWFDSARLAGEKAIQLDSNLSEGYNALSNAYGYKGDFDKSFELIKKALEVNPNNVQAIGNIATSYFSLGELSNALFWNKKSAGLNPKLYIPFQHIGWTYRILDDYDNAILWLKKSLEKKQVGESFEQLALAYIGQNNFDSALSQIPQLLSLIDTSESKFEEEKKFKFDEASRIFESVGVIYFFGGEIKKAKMFFEKSIKYNPSFGTDIWSSTPIYLGYILKNEGNFVDAELLLDGSLYINMLEIENGNQDQEHFFNVAAILAIQGDKENSLYHLNLAKQKKWLDTFKAKRSPIFKEVWNNETFNSIISEIEEKKSLMKNQELQKK